MATLYGVHCRDHGVFEVPADQMRIARRRLSRANGDETDGMAWLLYATCPATGTMGAPIGVPHRRRLRIGFDYAAELLDAGAQLLTPGAIAAGLPRQVDGDTKPFVPATFPHVPASSGCPSPFGPVAADQKTLQRGVAALLTACRPPAGPEDPGELAGHVDAVCEVYDAAIGRAKASVKAEEDRVTEGRVPGCAGRDRAEALRARVAFLAAARAAGVAALTGGRG